MNIEINDTDVAVLKEQEEGLINCLEDSHAPDDIIVAIKNVMEAIKNVMEAIKNENSMLPRN